MVPGSSYIDKKHFDTSPNTEVSVKILRSNSYSSSVANI